MPRQSSKLPDQCSLGQLIKMTINSLTNDHLILLCVTFTNVHAKVLQNASEALHQYYSLNFFEIYSEGDVQHLLSAAESGIPPTTSLRLTSRPPHKIIFLSCSLQDGIVQHM